MEDENSDLVNDLLENPSEVPKSLSEVEKVEGDKSIREGRKKENTAFEFEKYLILASSLEKIKKLGSGTYGAVYKGIWKGKGGGTEVAYKKIGLNRRFQPQRHLNEFKIMLKTQYPLVLQVFGYAVSEDQHTLYIVMELMDEDLLRYIDRKRLSVAEKVTLMIRMARCLHFLHSCQPRIIHRDVKSVNFLLKNDGGDLKICDFGIAKSKLSTVATSSDEGGKGTTLWMAPELFVDGAYTKSSDVYALAMTFFEVLNEELPFFWEIGRGNVLCNPVSIYNFIKEGKRPKCKVSVPEELVRFLDLCWGNDAKNRLSTSDIIEWLTEYKREIKKSLEPTQLLFTNRARRRRRGGIVVSPPSPKNVPSRVVIQPLPHSPPPQPGSGSSPNPTKDKFRVVRGNIHVPVDAEFLENRTFLSGCRRSFCDLGKVARSVRDLDIVVFKASPVFSNGNRFYFQVTVNIAHGKFLGFGLLKGEVSRGYVGGHKTGWEYECEPGGRFLYHNKKLSSSDYGPPREKGQHKLGIFCDFTNGKGELSFIVDGRNWGVAFDNVEPPVNPAFYLYMKGDSFKIDEISDVPACI